MKISADHVRIAIIAIESMTIQGKDAAAVADALGNFREVHKAMTQPAQQPAAPVAEPAPKRSHKAKPKTDLVAPEPPKTNGEGHAPVQ